MSIRARRCLGDDFKGFNFTVNDKQYTYKPGDGKELFNKQKDVNNFIKPYLDSESWNDERRSRDITELCL